MEGWSSTVPAPPLGSDAGRTETWLQGGREGGVRHNIDGACRTALQKMVPASIPSIEASVALILHSQRKVLVLNDDKLAKLDYCQ